MVGLHVFSLSTVQSTIGISMNNCDSELRCNAMGLWFRILMECNRIIIYLIQNLYELKIPVYERAKGLNSHY